ncbi:ferrous iron transport protein A [Thermodesulfobacteriota bacterium]|jgi:ferrous iron transport protein A
MGRNINLADISKGISYEVVGFEPENSPYAEKLYKMGFVKGTPVELAPVKLSDPMIVQIRGSRIALRKNEAEGILVKER